jgi:hypothetical protein
MIENIISNGINSAWDVMWVLIGIYGVIAIGKVILDYFEKKR